MTAVLPLTEDEEREMRADWGERRPHHGAGGLRLDVLRLLATLDAERAQRYPASVVEAVRALEWYADPANNGKREFHVIDDVATGMWRRIDDDEGDVARVALASLPKELRDAARAPR